MLEKKGLVDWAAAVCEAITAAAPDARWAWTRLGVLKLAANQAEQVPCSVLLTGCLPA